MIKKYLIVKINKINIKVNMTKKKFILIINLLILN